MKQIIYNLTEILFFPINFFSVIVPRKKNVWVFGAWRGHRYSDNSRYLYEYVLKNEREIRPIWLTRNKKLIELVHNDGGEAYLVNSLKGIWFAFRASTTVINEGLDDVNVFGIIGSKKIQLWHGTPLKKIGIDAINHFYKQQSQNLQWLRKFKNINPFHKWIKKQAQWDIIVTSSNLTQQFLSSAFGIPQSKVKITGDPRSDIILSRHPKIPDTITNINNYHKNQKIILYVPTFRDSDFDYFKGVDLNQLATFLERADALLLIKLHFVYRKELSNQSSTSQLDRIHFLEDDIYMDVNKILPFVDVLITDYSSIFYDYLLLDRPIIFTPFDYHSYLNERGFYVDYYEMTPGQKCEDWEEIICKLDYIILKDQDKFSSERKRIRDLYHTYIDTSACQRVTKISKNLL